MIVLALNPVMGQKEVNDPSNVILHSPDSSVVWIVYANKIRTNTFEIVAMGIGQKDKILSNVAGLTVEDAYGITTEKKTEKSVNKNKQVNLKKEIHVKGPGIYIVSGTVHYYVEGDKNVKKQDFQLKFKT